MSKEVTHILLIEDNPGDVGLVNEMLNDLDLKIYFKAPTLALSHCERLSEALSILSQKSFDIILVDLSLPDSQGIETIKAVCQIAPDLPIIVLSGQSGIETATLAVQEGAQDYLVKGHIDSQLLMRSIRYAIERKKKDIALQQLASLDSLTMLANRTFFNQKLTQDLALAKRRKWKMATLFLDLDRFKIINDNFSHKIGDIVLQTVATRLTNNLQVNDTIARIGGDEFVIILHKIENIFSIGVVVRQVLEAIKAPIDIDEKKLFVTASIGISLYPDDADEESILLKYADIAMYDAKHSGGDDYKFYALKMTNELQKKITLEKELNNALENERFSLLYQPQIDLNTNMICGVEAFLNFVRHDRSVLEANEIIPIIEGLDLIAHVGEWILKTIFHDIRIWEKHQFKTLIKTISIDISLLQLRKDNSIAIIKKISKRNRINKFQLEFEINESVIIQDIEPQIEMLKSRGIHLALDNIFAGSSSLHCLRTFQIDTVKIPKCLIQNICTSEKDKAIVIGIINISHFMGSTVVAQGVETKGQLEFLRTQGCDKAQGPYVCKAVNAKTLAELMQQGCKWPLRKYK